MGRSAEVDDFDAAFRELEAAVDAACEPSTRGWGDRGRSLVAERALRIGLSRVQPARSERI